MKTPLQELIEWMDGRAITHESVRKKATELLEKEREIAQALTIPKVNSDALPDVVCSSCGSPNRRWDKYEITLNDRDSTDVDVSVDYCEDCGHVFKLREY